MGVRTVLRQKVEDALSRKTDGSIHSNETQLKSLVQELWNELQSCPANPVNIPSLSNPLSSSPDSGESMVNYTAMVNQTLTMLGSDFNQNINLLTALLGQIFGATCALYNRLDEGMLCSIGQWATPADYNPVDKPDGHICYDVIRRSAQEILIVRNLPATPYAETDPNVKAYGLMTYVGKAVFCEGKAVGSLCAIYQDDIALSDEFRNLFTIIGTAIGVEETRHKASLALIETDEKLNVLINATPDIICFKDGEGRWLQANESLLRLYNLENIDYRIKTESQLAAFTSGTQNAAFLNCGISDELAWKAGKQFGIEETIPDRYGNLHIFDVIKVPLFNDDNSRKGLVVFGRDITSRKEAENETRFLNESALEFLELDDSVNIYEFIGEKVHQLSGRSMVMVTSFNETNQEATLRSLQGVGKIMDKVLKIMTRHPIGMRAKLTPERKRDVLYQKLTFRRDLFEMLTGAISRPMCRAIEKIADIGTIYEMGFAHHEFLLGDVTILTHGNAVLQNTEVIEAFIKLAAVALHRRQVKEALNEREESYRGLFNSISSAVYIMDREGLFLDVNEGATVMYGYPKERFIGNTPDFLSAPGKNESVHIGQTLKKTFGGVPQVIEFWGKRSSGEVFPKDVRFYKGKHLGHDAVIVIANDITSQYNMISQLVAAKEVAESNLRKTNGIISAIPDSIFIIDNKGKLIEFFSNEPDNNLNSQSDLQNRSIDDFIPVEIAELTRRHINEVLVNGIMQKYEYALPAGSSKKYYEARMVKLASDKVLAIVRNTTERMELIEALLQAKDRAEESDRLKTAFLHNISHEIRTPMNGIVGFSNLLTMPDVASEDVLEYNSIINSCSNQLLSIISDIVSIATLEAGQETVREVTTNLNEVLHVIYSQLISKATEKDLLLSYSTSLSNTRAQVMTDETKLNQVLTNLINNAIKFTENGEINIQYALEGDFLKFSIEDSGIGIPETMHEAIFDRFRQINEYKSGYMGGTGLGLSISKSYVELMGGKIWLESQQGSGAVFYFTIPYKPVNLPGQAVSQPGTHENPEILSGKTILIAEDEFFNFRLLSSMLGNYNLNLIRAENGSEAIRICKENSNIDLILMDLKMPLVDGFEATRQVRQFRPEMRIIAQSALALSGDKESALAAGCNDYISKPIRKSELIAMLTRYLQ